MAALVLPTPEPPPGPNWRPGVIDPETSIVEAAADVMRTPLPLLWLGDSFPLWLLVAVVLAALVLIGATWRILRRNRDY